MTLLSFILLCKLSTVVAYYNSKYTLTNASDTVFDDACVIRDPEAFDVEKNNQGQKIASKSEELEDRSYSTVKPLILIHHEQSLVHDDELAHCPSGALFRAELMKGQPAVHIPQFEYMHVGHCYLNVTSDAMQTAVDAFAIYIRGTVRDVLRLPPQYVLNSARTIAMMRVPNEKLNATWEVVKRGRKTAEVQHWELELFRPLFKYLNGREIARLDLTNPAILTYIGTHADLNRHQVGVVASRYIRLNTNWSQPEYLNIMNNLLCGVPMSLMKKIDSQTYLGLTHQVFYHIRACDALQRRFYLAIMTRTETLGKPYSWSARNVARMGLLMAELGGPDLASVAPEAMSGLSAQVVSEMPALTLQHITDEQVKYLGLKSLTILTRKLSEYRAQQRLNHAKKLYIHNVVVLVITVCFVNEINGTIL